MTAEMAQTTPTIITTENIDPQQVIAIRSEAVSWPEKARALTVANETQYVAAVDLLQGIKGLRNRIAEVFGPHIDNAFRAHKALVKEKADAEAPLTEAEGIIKRTLIAWTEEQERIRREEQQRLEELARKDAEERQLAEALAAEAAGETEVADALMAEPVAAPVVILPPAAPKVSGLSYRDVWRWRIVDRANIPREYLMVDEVKISGVVRAMKGATNIFGIQVYSEKVAAASGR